MDDMWVTGYFGDLFNRGTRLSAALIGGGAVADRRFPMWGKDVKVLLFLE